MTVIIPSTKFIIVVLFRSCCCESTSFRCSHAGVEQMLRRGTSRPLTKTEGPQDLSILKLGPKGFSLKRTGSFMFLGYFFLRETLPVLHRWFMVTLGRSWKFSEQSRMQYEIHTGNITRSVNRESINLKSMSDCQTQYCNYKISFARVIIWS